MRLMDTQRLISIAVLALLLGACGSDNPISTPDDVADEDASSTGDIDGEDVADDADPDAEEDADEDVDPDTGEDADADEDVPDAEPDTPTDVVSELCPPDQCEIDGKCVENGSVNPDNPCELCLVPAFQMGWSYDNTATCDDGDLCTIEDTCFEGTCMGVIKTCVAPGSCSSAECNPDTGECEVSFVEGACSDRDRCTVGDTCVEGVCEPGATTLSCDDGNPCTIDACDAALGCTNTPDVGAACDDGNQCTIGDVCNELGMCAPGGDTMDCDDASLCTIDWCDPGLGCQHRSIADMCTDDNPCTNEMCHPRYGCIYPFNSDPCSDGDACTSGDVCYYGVCTGVPTPIDDGNLCTDDFCDPDTGVVSNTNNTDACDDLDACTVGDMCSEGGCVSGTDRLDCQDDNVCTFNWCDPIEGCMSEPASAVCDDDNVCTRGDRCSAGECVGDLIDCDDFNDCTADFCDPVDGCTSTLIVSNECRPTITVTYPPRGATIRDTGSGTVTVTGNVHSGAGEVYRVTVNGDFAFPNDSGDFALEIPADYGGNFLVIEAEDTEGATRKVVQSFLFSDTYYLSNAAGTTGHNPEGLGFYLSDAALGVLGEIFELAVGGLDLSDILPDPVLREFSHTVRPRGANPITYGAPSAMLDSRPQGIYLNAGIPNLRARLEIDGWACDGDVDYTATSLEVTAIMAMSVVNNQLVADLQNVNATIQGGDLDIDCFLGDLIEAVVGDISGEFESEIESALTDEFGPLIADAFAAFALDFDLELPSLDPAGEPTTVTLSTDFQRVSTDDDGLNMVQRTIVTAPHTVPYTNLGVPSRAGCGSGPHRVLFFEDNELEVSLADDAINQLLHGAWRGGMLEFDVPPDLLGDLDLTAYGITDLALHASGMLAPTASDCVDGVNLNAHIGDLVITASMNLLGTELDVVLYVSMAAALEVTAGDGELGIAITDLERVELQVEVLDPNFISVESTFESLIYDNLVPSLLDALGGDALGSFPLPSIDIGGSIEGIPAGTIITITPERVQRNSGNSTVGGTLDLDRP